MTRLPKSHPHLHLVGSMRHQTLMDLAREAGRRLPERLESPVPLHLDLAHDRRSWFHFQRLYDLARATVTGPHVLRRLLREVAADEAAEGSGWVELQADPTGYTRVFGGLHEFMDALCAAAVDAAESTGVGFGLVVAANRTRHPADAATVARLAAQYAGPIGAAGLVSVSGFGLSNDERASPTGAFTQAFRIARRAGLSAFPHAGELAGPESVRSAVDDLGASRVGHGIAAAADPHLLERMAAGRVAAEVCPGSNVALGVVAAESAVPLTALVDAGVPVALGADDPLLTGSRLVEQYRIARDVHDFADAGLAALARDSVTTSTAPPLRRRALLVGIDAWLAAAPPAQPPTR